MNPTATTIDLATALAERLRGLVISPRHPEYDTARRVWNGMIDRRPTAIARCADEDDVATAIRFAHEHGLSLAVRGGGHNVAGTAVVDDGLVIDLSEMRDVHPDPSGGPCTCEEAPPGATSTASPRRSASQRPGRGLRDGRRRARAQRWGLPPAAP